jgi:putative ABC transport system permease protein
VRRLRAWLPRLASVFGASARHREIDDELAAHLELHVADEIAAGMAPAEARRRARLALGGIQQTKERVRDRAGLPQVESLLYDLRHAIRSLSRRKILVLTTTASIGFGVGVNIAAYAVLRGLLFSGWIVGAGAPERLIGIWPGLSFPNYQDLQARDLPVETAALQSSTLVWRTDADTTTVAARVVSENFFDVLRVRPVTGQTFPAAGGAGDRVIVSFDFWQRRLHGDRAIIGRALDLNGWPHVVVGVLPPEFKAPVGPMISASVYVPISPHVNNGLQNRGAAQFDLVGRLRDGVSRPQAYAALKAAAEQLERDFPDANTGLARSLRVFDGSVGPVQAMVAEAPQGRVVLTLAFVGYALVALVLVIACANVAGLLTARADERRHETAVRVALGASRGRLVQQSLAESLVLALLGCGVGAALWVIPMRLLPSSALIANAGIELVTPPLPLLLSLVLIVVVTVTCGLAPAFGAANAPPLMALKTGRLAGFVRRRRLQRLLVGAQVTISVVVLATAFLLAHAYVLLTAVAPGYDTAHTVAISARIPRNPGAGTMADVKAALERTPGVESVSYGALPLGLLPRTAAVHRMGRRDTPMRIDLHPSGPEYLGTMGIPLTRGRDLRDSDLGRGSETETPVVVNETFARRYLQASDPLEQRVVLERDTENGRPERTLRVVGVARDTKMRGLGDEDLPIVYIPGISPLSVVVRVAGPAAAAASELSNVAARALPGSAITVTPMSSRLRTALLPSRIGALLLTSLGGIGLLLAMTGLFGIISADATRRTFEIGVRMALGATRAAVLWLVLRRAIALVLVSALVGTVAALIAARALTPLLAAGQSTADPVALVLVILVLLVVAGAASFRPARRAANVDPVVALRTE